MVLITDKFGKASIDSDYAVATTVKTTRTAGGTVLDAYDLSKFAPDTPVYVVTYKKTIDPVTNDVSISNLVSWKAIVNVGANTLTNLTIAPGYIDSGNDVGDFIECIPTSMWVNDLIDGIQNQHNADGSHKGITTDTITVTSGTTLPAGDIGTADIANAAVTPDKMSGDTWVWEKLADVTLSSNGDTLSSGTFTARTYLRFYLTLSSAGSVDIFIRFNGDSGANYAATYAAPASTTLTTEVNKNALIISGVSAIPQLFTYGEIQNTQSKEKLTIFNKTAAAVGAGNAPGMLSTTGKWANTSNQITQLDVLNLTGGGDFVAGARLIVLGHN